MPKYHLNKYGEPARCEAVKIACPLGGADAHFDGDFKDSIVWAEKKNAENLALKTVPQAITNDSIQHSDSWYEDKERIQDALKIFQHNMKTSKIKKPEKHYSTNAGKLNITNYDGSGANYITPGEDSFVVLTYPDGKGARVISSYGEFYQDPQSAIGKYVVQYKQYSGNNDVQKDLVVVGYMSRDGKRYGYIPNRQVAFFVYK